MFERASSTLTHHVLSWSYSELAPRIDRALWCAGWCHMRAAQAPPRSTRPCPTHCALTPCYSACLARALVRSLSALAYFFTDLPALTNLVRRLFSPHKPCQESCQVTKAHCRAPFTRSPAQPPQHDAAPADAGALQSAHAALAATRRELQDREAACRADEAALAAARTRFELESAERIQVPSAHAHRGCS